PEPIVVEPEPVLAEAEPEPIVVEPEPVLAEAEPEPVLAEAEPEPIVIEPEPVLAEAEAEPEPEPPAPRRIVPITETILHIPKAPPAPPPADTERVAAQADDPLLAARRAQLDMLGLGDPGEGPVVTQRGNVLPYRSSGAGLHPAEMAARAGAQAPGAAASFWEASAKEVAGAITHVGVQSCGKCGLSLSASARFCRRCGTSQARSA
ncbi:MAG: hypothetical protein ACRDHD_05360, partial [Candidatus Limnocylindria bacterium]